MESDLAAVDRALHPWVIAVVHRPLYTSCFNEKEQLTMQQQFGDLFLAHKVDVVLSGHVHSYERTWPTMGGYSNVSNATSQVYPDRSVYVDPRYPIYVVSGAAGNGESVNNCTAHMATMVPYPWSFSAACKETHAPCVLICPARDRPSWCHRRLCLAGVDATGTRIGIPQPVTPSSRRHAAPTAAAQQPAVLPTLHPTAAGFGCAHPRAQSDGVVPHAPLAPIAVSTDIGYNRLWAHNETHLEFDYFSVSKAEPIDHFWIVRSQ